MQNTLKSLKEKLLAQKRLDEESLAHYQIKPQRSPAEEEPVVWVEHNPGTNFRRPTFERPSFATEEARDMRTFERPEVLFEEQPFQLQQLEEEILPVLETVDTQPKIESLSQLNSNLGAESTQVALSLTDEFCALAFPDFWSAVQNREVPMVIDLIRSNLKPVQPHFSAVALIKKQEAIVLDIKDKVEEQEVLNFNSRYLVRGVLVGSFILYIQKRTGLFSSTLPQKTLGTPPEEENSQNSKEGLTLDELVKLWWF